MNQVTVLITSAGRRNQLIECFRDDARALGMDLRVVAADANPALSPACHAADAAFLLPRCNAPDFVDALLALCEREKINLVVPTIDPELAVLCSAAERFAVRGVRLVVSSPEMVTLAGDKARTAAALAAAGIPTPRTLAWEEFRAEPERLAWPVIVKPAGGSASVGIHRLRDRAGLAGLAPLPGSIVQECWSGREFTVNVYFSPDGRLQTAVPHERLEVRSGEVSKGRTCRMPDLERAAERLAEVLPGARGPLCFQAIVRGDGEFVVFEINARFGGGFPLAHRAGARFTRWLLEEQVGVTPSYTREWRKGVTMLRFDSAVFLDA